ncbi:glyoxalase [Kordiimonas sediminis]|uniref:Glyoxalase n=1 Tax=Kordiimonas sediminis TaxID=1735581 RepID=A0A919AXJ5_9PROT|nr:ArsI/CadI family heavy metal resistance metalloenzyme [Kordiimonas sediminis]GHF31231.1 glyoxalase [Kordiimonas sediminis]
MKRLHVNISVENLEASIAFYKTLFATVPTVVKEDYAKWMLDDPRVNFAITSRGAKAGLDHLGIQVETDDELTEVYSRLKAADRPMIEEGETTCCYAQSRKNWIVDPDGLSWETFLTVGESPVYGSDDRLTVEGESSACCVTPDPQGGQGKSACC